MTQTPKEKAEELIYRFSTPIKVFDELEGWVIHLDSSKAKGHAFIAVDEILKALQVLPIENKGSKLYDSQIEYWQEVKKEIEKL